VPLWKPTSYELLEKHVALVRNLSGVHPEALALAILIRQVIEIEAEQGREPSLPCPSPSDDPDGRYRLVTYGMPIIQRLNDAGEWVNAAVRWPTEAPTKVPSGDDTP